MTDQSLAVRVLNENVSHDECLAVRHLYADGRTGADIAFVLERDEKLVYWQLNRECQHRLEEEE